MGVLSYQQYGLIFFMFIMFIFMMDEYVLANVVKPRNIKIDGQQFIDAHTNEPIVLGGPNVVVKGPPYLPSVSGNTICNDIVDSYCSGHGNCTTCSTFNQADVDHIKSRGWNFIRLGVVWAGAQTKDGDSLDPNFVERLHAVLNLTDKNGLHVMLDNHGDMTGTLGCGNGVPAWFQLKAPGVKEIVGKPLEAQNMLVIQTITC